MRPAAIAMTFFLVLFALFAAAPQSAADTADPGIYLRTRDANASRSDAARQLLSKARSGGTVSVIVTLDQVIDAEPDIGSATFRKQQSDLFAAQNQLVSRVHFGRKRLDPADRFETVPMLVLEVTEAELDRLMRDPSVISLEFNRKIVLTPRLDEMRAKTRIEDIWSAARADKGNGETIAIIDDGVDSDLPSIKGRVIEERCVSSLANCYDAAKKTFSTKLASGKYAAWGCATKPEIMHNRSDYCRTHGLTVTSTAAAARIPGKFYDGFGPKLDVIFIRTPPDGTTIATFAKAFELAFTSSKLHLGKVITTSIGFINERSDAPCAGAVPAFDTIIKKIRDSGMVVTNSAGNDESNTFIDFPGCHPSVLSIGASTEATDKIPKFSDMSYMVDFVAPGDSVTTEPSGRVQAGTSFSTPSVAATLALLKHAFPNKTMDDIVTGLRCGGTYLHRNNTVVSVPRIDAAAAYDVLSQPKPKQNFEFNKTDALKDWSISAGNWTLVGGEARFVPAVARGKSVIYTDLCLDDFTAEASIRAISPVPDIGSPMIAAGMILNHMPRGNGELTGLQEIDGYYFNVFKDLGVNSFAGIVKLTNLIPGSPATSRASAPLPTACNVNFTWDHKIANVFRVVKNKRRVQFFVNDVFVCEVLGEDDRYRSIGFYFTSLDSNIGFAPQTTTVDYLRVTGK